MMMTQQIVSHKNDLDLMKLHEPVRPISSGALAYQPRHPQRVIAEPHRQEWRMQRQRMQRLERHVGCSKHAEYSSSTTKPNQLKHIREMADVNVGYV